MTKILEFPNKKDFTGRFKGKISDDILKHMSDAYDRVNELGKQFPSAQFPVSPGFEEEARNLEENYNKYVLKLLKRILELESELCLSNIKT